MAWAWVEKRAVTIPPRVVTGSFIFFAAVLVLGLVLAVTTSPVFLVLAAAAAPGTVLDGYTRRLQQHWTRADTPN